jgi:ABC-type transporter Mla MlaB component
MAVIDTSVHPAVRHSRHASWVLHNEEGTTVITVEGDLDLADMAGVEFIDSSTMRALVRAHRLFESLGLRLTVREPSRPVRRMLGLCQLDEVINTA